MRPLLVIFFTAALHAASCPPLPPRYYVKPNLTVLLAEALNTPTPDNTTIRLKLQTLIHGAHPGIEFPFDARHLYKVSKGDILYIEQTSRPAEPFSMRACNATGLYNEKEHATRIQYFRELDAGAHPTATLRINTIAPGALITLQGPTGQLQQEANSDGTAEWQSLLPGVYQAHAELQHYDSGKPTEPFQLNAGACQFQQAHLSSRYVVRGTLRTPTGQPVPKVVISLYDARQRSYEAQTNYRGAFTLPYINPGKYRVRIQFPTRTDIDGEIDVRPNQLEAEANLILK